MSKIISVEKGEFLVQYDCFGEDNREELKNQYYKEGDRKLAEAYYRITLIHNGMIQEGFMFDLQDMEVTDDDFEEYVVGNIEVDKFTPIEFFIKQWIANQVYTEGDTPASAIAWIVYLLQKHGMWNADYYKILDNICDELYEILKEKAKKL